LSDNTFLLNRQYYQVTPDSEVEKAIKSYQRKLNKAGRWSFTLHEKFGLTRPDHRPVIFYYNGTVSSLRLDVTDVSPKDWTKTSGWYRDVRPFQKNKKDWAILNEKRLPTSDDLGRSIFGFDEKAWFYLGCTFEKTAKCFVFNTDMTSSYKKPILKGLRKIKNWQALHIMEQSK